MSEVSSETKAAKSSRTLEKLEEARKVAAALQKNQVSGTELKTNLIGQDQKSIAFRRITVSCLDEKLLYLHEDFIYSAIDELNWDLEVYEMEELGVSGHEWLTADDPVFWCIAPAYLEEVAWLFRTAPTRQPFDDSELPITLLEYYLRMDLWELLGSLWLAPKWIGDALCITWERVTKRRKLSTRNCLNQSSELELKWLFEHDLSNL